MVAFQMDRAAAAVDFLIQLDTTVFAKLPAFEVIFQSILHVQPTSVNEDGWRYCGLDGRDGRKLPFGGSFIS